MWSTCHLWLSSYVMRPDIPAADLPPSSASSAAVQKSSTITIYLTTYEVTTTTEHRLVG